MYYSGVYLKQNYERAFELLNKVIEKDKNNEIAKLYLFKMYYYGEGTKEDHEKASEIAGEIAPNLDYKKYKDEFGMEKYKVKNKYQWGEYLERNHDGIYELILELAGIYGDGNTKLSVAKVYYQGTNTKQNYKKAFKLFNEIAVDDDEALFYVAKMYYFGEYVEPNYEKAFNIFSKIVEDDDAAKYYIAEMYYAGKYVKQDYKKAFEVFNELTEFNNNAKYYIAEMYYYGNYVEQNYKKAFELFNEIAEEDHDAKYYIAEMYYYGKYVKRDTKKAFELFNEIAEEDENARDFIRNMYNDTGRIEKNSMSFNFWEEVMKKTFEIYDYLKELGYEDREEQQNMTMDIIQAIEDNQNIIIEARCWNWKILCLFDTINAILY
jgi:hypothetical protein